MSRLALLPAILVCVGACASAAPGMSPAPPPAAPVIAPVAATPAPPPAPRPPPAPATASDVLAAGRAPFDACYAAARKANPNLGRTNVEVTFTMDANGKLENVDFAYRNRFDDPAKDCMRAAAEALTFPSTLHGIQVGTITFAPP